MNTIEIIALTDRELLELAAKAAGVDLRPCNFELAGALVLASHPSGVPTVWNPLTDDGDALRLAVKLGIHLRIDIDSIECVDRTVAYTNLRARVQATEEWCDSTGRIQRDHYAATRRAIVRAAAKVGMEKPSGLGTFKVTLP